MIFTFEDLSLIQHKHRFYAYVMPSISSKQFLLEHLYHQLWFPGYFGFNWDALYDCLCDFSWMPYHDIVIIHHDLPAISEKSIYLKVLTYALRSWQNDDLHSLEVVFNVACKQQVIDIMQDEF